MKRSLAVLTIFAALLISCGTESTPWSTADVCPDVPGTLLDERDGQSYKTVKIGTQTWMAENLNYATGKSFCYDDADSNCVIYGRLYDWETAKVACPAGWHLPTDEEWKVLEDNMGGENEAGKRLKAISGWTSDGTVDNANGTDDCGFSALPGGGGFGERFSRINFIGYWWVDDKANDVYAYSRWLNSYYEKIGHDSGNQTLYHFSARCIQG